MEEVPQVGGRVVGNGEGQEHAGINVWGKPGGTKRGAEPWREVIDACALESVWRMFV